jgi:hypothetical protein
MSAAPARLAPSPEVRETIRDLLSASAQYHGLDPATRKDIAQGLVRISSTALALAEEERGAHASPIRKPSLSLAQNAGSEFSGVAAQRVADTTRQILNAVSFPRFVTELITGVFKALVDSNQQQMQAYVELIRNVAASTEGFADANVGVQGARQWLVETFPGSFVIEGEVDDFEDPSRPLTRDEQAERDASTRLRLKPSASMPSEAALRTALGLQPQDALPGGDPENLVGLARTSLARGRQQMLATMVMLGMQRIVIESGRLHASMRFHIDTRSAAADDRGSSFDVRNETEASGSFGYGPWGASAKVKNTIGYVSTQRTQTTEEMNTDLDLNSSVELVFKTDYLPLDRLAGQGQADRIRVQTLNPEAELKVAADERKARLAAQGKSEEARQSDLSDRLARRAEPAPAPPPAPPAARPATPPAATPPPAGSTPPSGATPAPGTPAPGAGSPAGGTPTAGATTPSTPGTGTPAPASGTTRPAAQPRTGATPPAGSSSPRTPARTAPPASGGRTAAPTQAAQR